MKKEERKELVEVAQYIWNECEGDIGLKLMIKGDLKTPEKSLLLDSLNDKGVIIIQGSTISISNNTKSFIDNGGYTPEELKEIKEDHRNERALRNSKWANIIAGLALLFSIASLIISLF